MYHRSHLHADVHPGAAASPITRRLGRRRPAHASLALVAPTLLVGLLATSCTTDDEMSASSCDAFADVQRSFFGDPAQIGSAIEAFEASAPGHLADDAEVLTEAAREAADDPAAFDSPATAEAAETIGDAAFDDCDASTTLDVTGVDFAYDGLVETVPAGRLLLRLTNDSATGQPHEVVIARGAAGEPASELAALPIDELMTRAVPVGVAYVESPGGRATTLVDLEAGSYLLICTLPVHGHSGEGTDGASHAERGMVATLEVT